MNKVEIEKELVGKGDFVQIDYLNRLLTNKGLALDRKKFVYKKLAELYEKKGMFRDVAKMYNLLALSSITFNEKIQHYVKETEFYIKAGFFNDADEAMKKASGEATDRQRGEIYNAIKEFYKKQGEAYAKQNRKTNAVKIYEKLLTMKISDSERVETKAKLMALYESIGRVKEYFALKRGM